MGLGAALGGVLGVGALAGQAWTADDLTPKAEDALEAAGYGDLTVEFTGREAVLSGTGTEAEFAAAQSLVEDIRGVRRVELEGEVVADVDVDPDVDVEPDVDEGDKEAPSLSLNVTDTGATLSGSLADVELGGSLAAAAGDALGVDVSDELSVNPDIDTPDWVAGMPGFLAEVGDVSELSLDIDGGVLRLGGSVGADADIERISAAAAASLPGLLVENNLEVAGLSADDVAEQLADLVVQFDSNADEITDEGAAVLDDVLDLMSAAPGVSIEIQGHTARTRGGSATVAERISQERADSVFEYLVDAGADPDRLTTVARGGDEPVAGNETEKGRVQNRRATFGIAEGSD